MLDWFRFCNYYLLYFVFQRRRVELLSFYSVCFPCRGQPPRVSSHCPTTWVPRIATLVIEVPLVPLTHEPSPWSKRFAFSSWSDPVCFSSAFRIAHVSSLKSIIDTALFCSFCLFFLLLFCFLFFFEIGFLCVPLAVQGYANSPTHTNLLASAS